MTNATGTQRIHEADGRFPTFKGKKVRKFYFDLVRVRQRSESICFDIYAVYLVSETALAHLKILLHDSETTRDIRLHSKIHKILRNSSEIPPIFSNLL